MTSVWLNRAMVPAGLLVLAVALPVLCCGCGGGDELDLGLTGTISGTVSHKGQPLTTGRIQFYSVEKSTGGGADLGSDGTYTIETPLPVGSYVVTVHPVAAKDMPPPPDPLSEAPSAPAQPPPFAAKYASMDDSPLTADIEEGENSKDFDLTE